MVDNGNATSSSDIFQQEENTPLKRNNNSDSEAEVEKIESSLQDSLTDKSSDNDNFENTTMLLDEKLLEDMDEVIQEVTGGPEQQYNSSEVHSNVSGIRYFQNYKFPEIREFILTLHKENEELRKPLQILIDLYETRHNVQVNKLISENIALQEKLQQVNQKLTRKEEEEEKVITSLTSENTRLREEVCDLRDKHMKIQRELQNVRNCSKFNPNKRHSVKDEAHLTIQSNMKLPPAKNEIFDLRDRLEKSERRQRELLTVIDKLRAQEHHLRSSLNSRECSYSLWNALFPTLQTAAPVEDQLVADLKSVEELILKLECPQAGKKRSDATAECWLDVVDPIDGNDTRVCRDLKLKNIEFQKLLNEEKCLNLTRKEVICHMKNRFRNIYRNCFILLKKESAKNNNSQGPEGVEEDKVSEEIKLLKSELHLTEGLLRQRENEVAELRESLKEYHNQSEEMMLLKDQLKVFEEDFNMERESKHAISAENQIIKQELSGLRFKNNELLNTLNRRTSAHNSSNQATQSDEYPCLLRNCAKVFRTVEELQDHVNQCVEDN